MSRRIFALKRDEITGEWRKLHNEELYDLYSTQYCSCDKIENNEMCGHVARMGKRRGVYGSLVGKPEEITPLGRPRHRWNNNIKMGR
jgi:hypothetical protein